MKLWKLAGSSAVIALVAGGSAWAAVTPEQVWQNWQEVATANGQKITAAPPARQGDTLVVSNVEVRAEQPDVKSLGTIAEIRLRDKGDGTVEITASDSFPVTLTFKVEDKPEVTAKLLISSPGLVTTASGDLANTSYDLAGPKISVVLQSVESTDPAVGAAVFDMAMSSVTGKYLVTAGTADGKMIESSMKAATTTIKASFKASEGDFAVNASIADLEGASSGNFLGAAAMTDPLVALRAGFAVDGTFSYGAVKYDVEVTEQGKVTKATGAATGGDFNVAMSKDGLAYGGSGKGVTTTLTSGDIPFPVSLAYDEGQFNLVMPLTKSDVPGDFALLTRVAGLTVSEEVWALIDPQKTLPRDPATLVIDTKGTATLNVDLMDEEAMKALGEASPVDLQTLDIPAIRLSIAGADLTGNGAFTFDNTDTTTFGGVPAPTGKLNLKLVGGNGLLDKLVALGLVPADGAMQVRMMAAMFARPGTQPDELTSEVEFKDKGLFVNGQQMQ